MRIRHRTVRAHRFLLVVGTTVLAVGGSRVANEPTSISDWLLTLSGACAMYVADIARDIDETLRQLPQGRGDVRERATAEILETRARWLPLALLVAVVVALIGLIGVVS